MDPSPPKTVAEAATLLGVKESFLRREALSRRVPCQRPHAKLLLFTVEDIAAIRALWVQPVAEKPDELTTPRSRKRSAA
jgi:hypothetical protein